MTGLNGSPCWFVGQYWTLPLLGLCYCFCYHGSLAANVSFEQATSVTQPNVPFHTEPWQPNERVTEVINSNRPKPTVSQPNSSVDTHDTMTYSSQRSTSTMTPVSPKSASERETTDVSQRSDITTTNSPAETSVSTLENHFTNDASSERVESSADSPLITDVTSITDVADITNIMSPSYAESSSDVSPTNTFSGSNVAVSNETSTNAFSESNITVPNESTVDNIASSTNNDSLLTNSFTSSLTSQGEIYDNDKVTLNRMPDLETGTHDYVMETESEYISPGVTQASKIEDLLGNGTLTSILAVTKNVTSSLQTVESHSSTEVFTSPSSDVPTSDTTDITTSVVTETTSSLSDAFHPPRVNTHTSTQSTAVPATKDTNGVTLATYISLAETSSVEIISEAAVILDKVPPTSEGQNETMTSGVPLLTPSKPQTTVSIVDIFKKRPKTRLQVKIADNHPTRYAAVPTEKPFPKRPIKSPNAPLVKYTTPTVSTTTPSPTPWLPALYITLILKTSRGEFCSKFKEFQGIIAKLLVNKINKNIYPDQVRLLESDRCPTRTARSVQTVVRVYMVNPKEMYDFEMSNILAKVIQVDQIRRLVGSTFEDKILDFKIHGKVHVGQDIASESPDPRDSNEIDSGVVIAIGISCLAGLCIIGLIIVQVVYVKRRRGIKRMRKSFRERYSVDVHSIAESIQMGDAYGRRGARFVYDNPALNWCEPKDYTSNVVDTEGLAKMVDDTDAIEDEFLLLPSKMPKLSDVPLGAEDKNRYANVIPNPETRVRLTLRKGEDNSDYINANFLRGYLSSPHGYIATQAPLEGTCADFWRMAWEQRCQIIIMLTGLEEHGLSKCAEYWPNTDGGDVVRIYGDFEIVQQRRQVKTEWIMSMVTLRYLKTNQCREIRHFWMTAWPVNGLPDARTVIHFLLALRPHLEETTAPPIIHCSPGTGRTGTLIAIDLGMLSYDDTKMVDVLASVYRMRQDRGGMVQTREQYEYIYRVLHEYVQMAISDT